MANKIYCGVDVGGTKILAALVDDRGRARGLPRPLHVLGVIDVPAGWLQAARLDGARLMMRGRMRT